MVLAMVMGAYIKVKVLVLSLDPKLVLTTSQFYPAGHWKWPHSYILSFTGSRPGFEPMTYHHLYRHTDRHIDTQTNRHTDKQTHKQTNTQTNKHTDKQTNKHTDKLTNKHTDRQTE